MEHRVKNFMKKNRMLDEKDAVLVGISGGPDSVCLLRMMIKMATPDQKIYGVHVNHMLRDKTALRDEAFVKELCAQWDIPLKIYHKDVGAYAKEHKKTLEEAGRILRYECFAQSSKEWECKKIALAHHKDDLAETVLFRMIRGTGLKGLGAMKAVAGPYIRPLLCLSKEEIMAYLEEIGQVYVTDETNAEITYSRNYIRNKIMPEITGVNPKAVDHIANLSVQATDLEDYMQGEIKKCMSQCVEKIKGGYALALNSFEKMHPYMQGEVLRNLLYMTAKKEKDIGLVHVQALQKVLASTCHTKRNKQLNLPYGVTAVLEETMLQFYEAGQYEKQPVKEENICQIIPEISSFGEYEIKIEEKIISFSFVAKDQVDYTNNDCVKYLDYDKIMKGICVRNLREDDYMVIDKEGHKKSLRRIFIDSKIPKEERGNRLLLADGNHIIWITQGRISESYKVTEQSSRVLRVTLQ